MPTPFIERSRGFATSDFLWIGCPVRETSRRGWASSRSALRAPGCPNAGLRPARCANGSGRHCSSA